MDVTSLLIRAAENRALRSHGKNEWIEEDSLQRNVLHWSPPGTGRRERLEYIRRIAEERDGDSRFWTTNVNRRKN
jgi:hypothetical protein